MYVWVYFWTVCFCSIDLFAYVYCNTTLLFITLALSQFLKSGSVSSPILSFSKFELFYILYISIGILNSVLQFLPKTKTKPCWHWDWNCIESIDLFNYVLIWKVDSLIILSWPTLDQSISPYLFRSLDFQQYFVVQYIGLSYFLTYYPYFVFLMLL